MAIDRDIYIKRENEIDYIPDTYKRAIDRIEHYYMNSTNSENKEENKMFENTGMRNMFNGLFGRIAPDMCRLTMSGKIAIKTESGYKSYDVDKNRLTNCDNFAFNIGEDFFFVVPTNKVERGDIILANGKPHCVLNVNKETIEVFTYACRKRELCRRRSIRLWNLCLV